LLSSGRGREGEPRRSSSLRGKELVIISGGREKGRKKGKTIHPYKVAREGEKKEKKGKESTLILAGRYPQKEKISLAPIPKERGKKKNKGKEQEKSTPSALEGAA